MRERSCSWPRSTARPAWRRSSSMRLSMRLKPVVSFWTSRAAQRGGLARMPGALRSTWSIVCTRRSIGSRRRRISSEFRSTALNTASASSSRPSELLAAPPSWSRVTTTATMAVMPTSSELTARTWVRSVRVRITLLSAIRPETLMGVTAVFAVEPDSAAILSEVLKPDRERVIS